MSESETPLDAVTSSDDLDPEKRERLLHEKSDLEYWFNNYRILMKGFRMRDSRITLDMLISELDNMVLYSLQPNESCPTVEEKFEQFRKSGWYKMQCVLIREKYHFRNSRLRKFSALNYKLKARAVFDVSKNLKQILEARRYGARSENPWLRELDETDSVKDGNETQTRPDS